MIRYECDKCGASLTANDPSRFIVKLEVYAAAGPVDIPAQSVSEADVREVLDELSRADPDDVEDQTYRCLKFDLCDACRRDFMKQPLG